jgi:hypothetical protein
MQHQTRFPVFMKMLTFSFQGKLMCQGTVSQLKSQFNCGFQLTIHQSGTNNDDNDLEKSIKKFYPKLQKVKRKSKLESLNEQTFSLPIEENEEDQLERLSELFKMLELKTRSFYFFTEICFFFPNLESTFGRACCSKAAFFFCKTVQFIEM